MIQWHQRNVDSMCPAQVGHIFNAEGKNNEQISTDENPYIQRT